MQFIICEYSHSNKRICAIILMNKYKLVRKRGRKEKGEGEGKYEEDTFPCVNKFPPFNTGYFVKMSKGCKRYRDPVSHCHLLCQSRAHESLTLGH